MKTAKLLTVVVVLQGLILLGQWTGGGPSIVTPAQAQIPDAGGQRIEIINQVKELNGKMERLIGILESGKLEVRTTPTDDNKGRR
jgi:hypothetical protein